MVWLASGLAWFTRYFIQHENRASHEPPRPAELWLLLNKSEHSPHPQFLAFMPLKRVRNSPSRTWQTIKRADRSSTSIANDMRVDFGRSNVAMPENFLNRPDIATRSQ